VDVCSNLAHVGQMFFAEYNNLRLIVEKDPIFAEVIRLSTGTWQNLKLR